MIVVCWGRDTNRASIEDLCTLWKWSQVKYGRVSTVSSHFFIKYRKCSWGIATERSSTLAYLFLVHTFHIICWKCKIVHFKLFYGFPWIIATMTSSTPSESLPFHHFDHDLPLKISQRSVRSINRSRTTIEAWQFAEVIFFAKIQELSVQRGFSVFYCCNLRGMERRVGRSQLLANKSHQGRRRRRRKSRTKRRKASVE